MDDHETDLLDAVRTALIEAGFDPGSGGGQGVHLVRHARGVMVGWMPEEIDELLTRTSGAHASAEGGTGLAGLHHATGLALAAALRTAGFTTETLDDHILVLPPPPA
ncbi:MULTISPECIES: hypothetical protein [unclassified Streptomyces]|uniref:hypothetical protein n=1 Tax=unclassified Streptomyces TaxID=2593676 RepID=UPI00224E588C|nr:MULTISPECIES: hypothetical protein [unclassified Streptomyces]MCX4633495.1 hypothetical protein [Streptomyces sp. NBC_01443]WSW49747.1 hypothetical protein OG296_42800 [Streptomyces sp. NBC_01001]